MCNLLFLCPICHAVFSRFHTAKREENGKHQNRADCEGHIDVLYEARDDEADERNACDSYGIGELGRDVRQVVALRTGGRHDRGIRDGRAVIAADRARAAGRDADDQQRAFRREDGGDDRNENTERTPRGAGGKGEHAGDKEDKSEA